MEGVVILGIVVGIVGVLVFGLRTAARRAFPDIAQDIDQEKTLAKGASKDLFQLRRALKNRSLEREKLLKKGVRRFGWEALAKDVRRIVANPNEYDGLRVVAVRLFAQHDPAPVDALGTIADNRHETLKMRQLACQLLGERGGTDIERHLLRALRQGDPDSPNGDLKLRRQLLEILAVHGTARAKDLILQVWADHVELAADARRSVEAIETRTLKAVGGRLELADTLGGELSAPAPDEDGTLALSESESEPA